MALGVEQRNKYSPTPSRKLYRASNYCRIWKVRRPYAALSCNQLLDIFDDWQTGSVLNGIEVNGNCGKSAICDLIACIMSEASLIDRQLIV